MSGSIHSLVGREGQLKTTDRPGSGGPAAPRTRNGLKRWLRGLFCRGRSRQQRPPDGPGTVLGGYGTLPAAPPAALYPSGPGVPGADIAALVLGPLELSVVGRRVLRWNSLKARAVLQYLLIHQDRPVRRDVLMEMQWPDHTHNSARNNLNVALYSLRNTLDGPGQGVQPIVYRDGCYSLNPQRTTGTSMTASSSARQTRRGTRPGRGTRRGGETRRGAEFDQSEITADQLELDLLAWAPGAAARPVSVRPPTMRIGPGTV